MLTDDIRLERVESEYQSVRGTQDRLMDRMNGYGDFLQRLLDRMDANSRAIEANSHAIEANSRAIEANRQAIEELRDEVIANRRAIAENSQMLADIMDHLQVPRKRTGFTPE